MADVGGVNNAPGALTPAQAQTDAAGVQPANQPVAGPDGLTAPVGQPGRLGQPVGLPAPPSTAPLMPDALAGRDPSQLIAAEQMRARGGASATEELLGLNRQPTILGALSPPPGNAEALRHMTPTMRRTMMRNLLDRQRGQMRGLARLMRRERDGRGGGGDGEESPDDEGRPDRFEATALTPPDEAQRTRARAELGSAARMLDLLDELLAMQDYAVSQMGTFSQG
ncbi:MAG TPA: hypothetical protein VK422_04015 [Pyrinomonadaceae bacterium]|nr:hypothetical protein [Pyrinomonadaceae bacterium]